MGRLHQDISRGAQDDWYLSFQHQSCLQDICGAEFNVFFWKESLAHRTFVKGFPAIDTKLMPAANEGVNMAF
jgi:hypothetical protein